MLHSVDILLQDCPSNWLTLDVFVQGIEIVESHNFSALRNRCMGISKDAPFENIDQIDLFISKPLMG